MSAQAEDQLAVYHVRPRFQVDVDYSLDEIVDRIKKGLDDKNTACEGWAKPGYAKLFMPAEEQHYWSPQLTLNMEETEEGTHLRGLFGPRPAVWTMFVFFYTVIGVAILFIGIFGLSYWQLGKSANILWLVPVLVLLFLSLYLVAFFGQKLGHDQIEIMHRFLEKCLGMEI
jgi:hypothetical protein